MNSPLPPRDPAQAQPGFDAQRGIRFGAKTLVVMPERDGAREPSARDRGAVRDAAARLDEAVGLAAAINLNVVERDIVRIRKAAASTLFGKGQIERLKATVAAHDIEVVVVDGALSPIQQRNLEKALDAKVIDRTGLILEIFGERATTREGSLQVELAHLDYQASRLVRSWTHLERQRGGVGFLGGPGETQIEADRRQIRDKMAKLRRELDEVKRTRALHRDRRQKAPYPVVALVGYTNAGKSTLFNRLTGATVMAEDLLFATLDPTMRAIDLPGVDKVILSDTVGFISALPTQLVAAFRATLEEVVTADLIVHVRDVAHPDSAAQAADVLDVLRDLGVIDGEHAVPLVTALNKIDLLDDEARAGLLGNLPDDAGGDLGGERGGGRRAAGARRRDAPAVEPRRRFRPRARRWPPRGVALCPRRGHRPHRRRRRLGDAARAADPRDGGAVRRALGRCGRGMAVSRRSAQ